MKTDNYEMFLKLDMSEFIGEWVVIIDGEIVAHGKNVKEVLKEAITRFPGKRPMIARIPEKETMIF